MPPEDKNELDKFLEGVTHDSPKLDTPSDLKPSVPEETPEKEVKPNRAERRAIENASIRQQLQEEREARIAAEARATAIAELKSSGDIDENLYQALFGNAPKTPETKTVTENLRKVLDKNLEDAEERAFQRLSREQQEETRKVEAARMQIDTSLSAVEEAYDVDLTSTSAEAIKARTQLLKLVEKLSPKDAEGNVTSYADFNSAFEILQQTPKAQTNPRAKDLADRSLQKSGQADLSKEENDATRAWLRRNGIKV